MVRFQGGGMPRIVAPGEVYPNKKGVGETFAKSFHILELHIYWLPLGDLPSCTQRGKVTAVEQGEMRK